jgi:hypothetical protein
MLTCPEKYGDQYILSLGQTSRVHSLGGDSSTLEVFSARQYIKKFLQRFDTIFGLKMIVKSGLEKIILKYHGGLQRYLLICQANSAFLGRLFCTGQQQL